MNRIFNNMHIKYKKVAFIKASSLWLLKVALKINSFMFKKKKRELFCFRHSGEDFLFSYSKLWISSSWILEQRDWRVINMSPVSNSSVSRCQHAQTWSLSRPSQQIDGSGGALEWIKLFMKSPAGLYSTNNLQTTDVQSQKTSRGVYITASDSLS